VGRQWASWRKPRARGQEHLVS